MKEELESVNLLYTKRGRQWLEQFAIADREVAERIVRSLTLVSHSQFERSLQRILESEVVEREAPVAFFAVREVDAGVSYFEKCTNSDSGEIDALVHGADHGSEARIASIIRNYCKTSPGTLLNHPTIKRMRSSRCRTIILVDDFIGSGKRTSDFIQSFWCSHSVTSWRSLKYIRFIVVAYSGTDAGIRRVKKHKARPEIVIERGCPSFKHMPWRRQVIEQVRSVCQRYGKKTCKKRFSLGFLSVMGSMVFEHGCPNNAPAILWAPSTDKKPWSALFPDRVILAGEKSAFPPEITRQDPVRTLLDVGQKGLAKSGALMRRGKTGETILIILALIAKGQRRQIALSYATGLSELDCLRIVEKCIKWEFITQSRRITQKGRAELMAARQFKDRSSKIPERGEECYYPTQLRRAARG